MKYNLRIQCQIQATDDNGAYSYGPGLSIEENLKFDAANFTEIAAILGRFHELGERIKESQS